MAKRISRLNVQGLARREPGLMSALVPPPGEVFVSVDLSAGEPTCYEDAVTEFLTRDGWRRFNDIPQGVEIAQVHPVTRNLEFVLPTNRVAYPVEEFVELSGKTARYSVTSNHKVLYVNPKRPKKVRIETAEYVPNNHDFSLQAAHNAARISHYSKAEIWTAAMIAADGSWDGSKWDISLYRDKKKVKACELLGPHSSVRVDQRKETYLTGHRWRVSFSSPLLNPKTKELDLATLGLNQVQEFIDALLFWDGSGNRFYSKHRHVMDHIQSHLCQLGVIARIGELNSGVYSLTVIPNKMSTCVSTRSIKKERGLAVCFEVPSGFLMVRQFGRYPWVSGNCTTHFSKDKMYRWACFDGVGKAPFYGVYKGMDVLFIDDIYLMTMSVSPIGKQRMWECFHSTFDGGLTFAEQWLKDAEVIKKVLKKERQIHKILALALGYSMGPKKMVKSAYNAGYKLSLEDARKFFKVYWELFSGVRNLGLALQRSFKQTGSLINPFGYRLVPDKREDYKCLNYFIQSSVSGVMNVLCTKFFAVAPFCTYVTVIHDEVLLSVPLDRVEDARLCMERAVASLNHDLRWDVFVRTGWVVGSNLYEAK